MAGPFYHAADANLGASLGQSLGAALFGNPDAALKLKEARQRMAYMAAEQANADASAGKATEETRGIKIGNDASQGLPDMFRTAFMGGPQPQAPVPFTPGVAPAAGQPDPLAVQAPAQPSIGVNQSGLVPLIAAMAQMKGKDVNIGDALNGVAAFSGNDTLQREGMMAAGHSPSKDFAGTAARADDVAQQGYDAELNKATTVEGMKGQVTERGQNLEHGDRMRGQNIESGDRRRGQDLEHTDRIYGDDLKDGGNMRGGWTPRGPNSNVAVDGKEQAMSARLGIGSNAPFDVSRIPQVVDAISATEGANPANNNPTNIIDSPFARSQPGYAGARNGFAVFNSPDAGRNAAITLATADYKRGQTSIQSLIEGLPQIKPGKATAPKAINEGTAAVLFGHQGQQGFVPGELDKQIAARGIHPDEGTLANMRGAITARFQQNGGNAAEAVGHVLDTAQAIVAHRQAGGAGAGQLRSQALAAITQGADPAQVKARFKQMTGQELQGS